MPMDSPGARRSAWLPIDQARVARKGGFSFYNYHFYSKITTIMEIESQKNLVIKKLIEKGYSKEQAEGFVAALQDTDLAKEVNELTNAFLAYVAVDIAADLLP